VQVIHKLLLAGVQCYLLYFDDAAFSLMNSIMPDFVNIDFNSRFIPTD
jgi:hypothetical protein